MTTYWEIKKSALNDDDDDGDDDDDDDDNNNSCNKVFSRDMVFLRNVSVDTLHIGDT